jgi:hypothetical protein
MWEQVLHLCRTAGKIIVLNILNVSGNK